MRKSRFSESQIVEILKANAAGTSAAELARRHGLHPNTLRQWRIKYGRLEPTDIAKVRALTEANARLKRRVAELHLDLVAYRSVLEKHGWSVPQAAPAESRGRSRQRNPKDAVGSLPFVAESVERSHAFDLVDREV